MEHTLNAYARQLGFTARNYRLQRDSDRSGLLRDVARTENLRGVVLMSSADHLEDGVLEQLGALPCPAVILDSYFTYDELPDNVWKTAVYQYDELGLARLQELLENGK